MYWRLVVFIGLLGFEASIRLNLLSKDMSSKSRQVISACHGCSGAKSAILIFVTFSAMLYLMMYLTLPRDTYNGILHGFIERGIAVKQSVLGRNTNSADVTYDVDYIPEDIALQLPACEDYKLSPDSEKSRLSLQDPGQKTVFLGDNFSVSIRLYDGYGDPISRGGADVRPRMFDVKRKAYATAVVRDHGNGTYTATFTAVWVGNATIKVKIAHTPDDIRAIYYIRKKLRSTREIEGTYSVNNIREKALCHPKRDALLGAGYSKICNLTGDNSGMPWYCGRPSNVRLICEDWTGCNNKMPFPDLPLTPCESALLNRTGGDMNDSIKVTIKPGQGSQTILKDPSIPCNRFSPTTLWTMKHPTGFMYNNTWHLMHCKGYDNRKFLSCLYNKSVLIFGDSTTRQWYAHVLKNWNCTPTSEKWTNEKWHKRAACVNRNNNFTVEWMPHSQPVFFSDKIRYTRTSIVRHLDEIGSDVRVVAIVHIYLHTVAYHHSVFREKIRRIRPSVQNLLNRNKYAKVLVKGFQTFYDESRIVNDYYGKLYKHILFEEFAGLHDRVVYLDHKDMTDAVGVYARHPPATVVAAMINQMLNYVC